MLEKIRKFLIKNKIIIESEAKIKIITDKKLKVRVKFYSERFPIKQIIPKNLIDVIKERIFVIKWESNKRYTIVNVIAEEGGKQIMNKSFNLKRNETKEVKI